MLLEQPAMSEYDDPRWEASVERYAKRQADAARLRRGAPPPAAPIEPAECSEIVRALEEGSADWYDVQRRLITTLKNGRVWRTEEWKELRNRLIKDHCEQCGSAEGPFTLHHLMAPVNLTDFARQLRGELFHQVRTGLEQSGALEGLQERLGPDGKPRLGCPFCGGTNLRERMRNRRSHATKPRFVCQTGRNYKVCKREFEEPVLLQPLRLQTPANQRYHLVQETFAERYASAEQHLYLDAAVLAVRQFARYMAGEDTATFCRKCAYLWDEKGMRLCQTCNRGWHRLEFKRCSACAPAGELVLCEVCGKHRHQPRYASCYLCAAAMSGMSKRDDG